MKFFTTIVLSLLPYITGTITPFNSSNCTSCIEKFNYLHSHNESIVQFVANMNDFCDHFNITNCRNWTKKVDKYIMKNSTEICQDLGVCDVLDIDNFIYQDPYSNINIYTYYDLLLAFKVNVLSNSVLNYTQLWSVSITEPFQKFEMVSLQNTYATSQYGITSGCVVCSPNSWAEYILKMTTDNYIYYLNITDGNVLYRLQLNGNRKLDLPISMVQEPNSQFVYDIGYNGSVYVNSMVVNSYQSYCNYTTPTNPTPVSQECLYNDIALVNRTKMRIQMPYERPRCGTALEMYCPHNNKGKEDCLSCMVRHREALNMCDVVSEENWCDRN
jgi:hypothetical protein